jgi:cholestenol delta-isomerase
MSAIVFPQPIPSLSAYDWAVVYVGLSVSCGIFFQFLDWSVVDKTKKKNVYTLRNFWLILSGVIHCWIEFNFVYSRGKNSILKPAMDMYAAADFRYGNYNGWMESGTTAMEAITALVDGPLCFLVAVAATHEFSLFHPLQIILCTMQIYGLAWFTLQPIFSDIGFSAHFSPDPFLFWLIAFGANLPWAIFPTILLFESVVATSKSFSISNKLKNKVVAVE